MTVRSNIIQGIFPSDIVIRTAIQAALDDIRSQPALIDFLFQSLLSDQLTLRAYGEKELQTCKDWITNNEIAITMGYHLNQVKIPHVAIWLGSQEETQQTTGDINEIPSERIQWVTKMPPALIFTPSAYQQSTGIITLPPGLSTQFVFEGMRVLDRVNNRVFPIEEVLDDTHFRIPAGSQGAFTQAEVLNRDDLWMVKAESVTFKETFNIDCMVQGDATKCIVLHQLILFILYRYKQSLLEARGLENTVVTSTQMGGIQNGNDASQIIWKRSITLTGFTRQYWPKEITAPIQGISVGIHIPTPEGQSLSNVGATQSWDTVEDEDALAGAFK